MITQNDFLASERFEYEKFFTCRYEPASSKGIVGFVFYRDGFGDLVKVQEVKDLISKVFAWLLHTDSKELNFQTVN